MASDSKLLYAVQGRSKHLRLKLFVVALLFAAVGSAQSGVGTYLGPGILRGGASDIGSRGGEAVDLRFYIGANGVVDTGYQGIAVDSQGNLINPGALLGVSLAGGAYGVHNWKKAQLGLDYGGDFRHYPGESGFDNTSHNLTLGYTYRATSRIAIDLRESASQFTRAGFGSFSDAADPNAIQAATLLDSRYYGINSNATITYLASARTSYTFGGGWNYQNRHVPDSFQSVGYDAIGSVNRKLSARTSVGVEYVFNHVQARDDSFTSDVHSFLGTYAVQIGPAWKLNFGGGVFIADVDQRVPVRLDPALAVIFGTDTLILPVQTRKISPSGNVSLAWQKNRSSFTISGNRSVAAGAAYYLTSTTETAGIAYSYTGLRKWSATIGVSDYRTSAIGTAFGKYNVLQGSTGFTYSIYPAVHLVGRFDIRRQNVIVTGYGRNPASATLGIMFSPGTIPLSFR